jgi:hypothetical protein
MISNERRWPARLPARRPPYSGRERQRTVQPLPPTGALAARETKIERKRFLVELKENPGGRYLRITESVAGRDNTIIIPASGLRNFQELLKEMLAAANEIPEKSYSPQPHDADGNC